VTRTGALAASTVERPPPTAVRAARLFDGVSDDLVLEPIVVLDDERIVSVPPHGQVPDDAHLLDLPGTTLLPGLIDAHVHLSFDASDDPVGALAAPDDNA